MSGESVGIQIQTRTLMTTSRGRVTVSKWLLLSSKLRLSQAVDSTRHVTSRIATPIDASLELFDVELAVLRGFAGCLPSRTWRQRNRLFQLSALKLNVCVVWWFPEIYSHTTGCGSSGKCMKRFRSRVYRSVRLRSGVYGSVRFHTGHLIQIHNNTLLRIKWPEGKGVITEWLFNKHSVHSCWV